MKREIKIGHIYRHFKGKYYVVVDIVNDCESNNDVEYKKIVIYKALYGDSLTWARQYDMFNSEVDREKYPNVAQHYRFEEIENAYLVKNIINEYRTALDAEVANLINTLINQ